MFKKILLTLVCFTMFLATSYAAALKVAVVDMDTLFQGYYKTKQTDAVLKQKQGIYQAWSKKLGDSRVKLEEEFKILRDAAQNIAFSSTERENKRLAAQKKYQEFKEKEAELQQYVQQKSRDYKALVARLHKKLLKDIYKQISAYAVLKGYNFVFDKSGKTLNGISIIIYSGPQYDVSEEILRKLNRGHANIQ